MNKKAIATIKISFLIILAVLLILIPSSLSEDIKTVTEVKESITYTPTTKTVCRPVTTTEEICYTDYCVDYENVFNETSGEDEIVCVDLRDEYCRNNTLTRQQCEKTLYSGVMFAQNSSAEWVNPSDVLSISKYQDDITFSYNGIKGDYSITFESGVIYNGNYKSMAEVKGIYPDIEFDFPHWKNDTYRKYAVNISNIPSVVQPNIDYITLTYKSHDGFTIDQLKTANKKYQIMDAFELLFDDLIEHNFTVEINVSDRRIYIGNLTDKFVDDGLWLDPTVQLWDANTDNLDDTHVYSDDPDTNYGSITYLMLQIVNDTGENNSIFLKFDISSIPVGVDIDHAEVLLLSRQNTLASQEDINSHIHRVFPYPTYNISNEEWKEENITFNNKPNRTQYNHTAESSRIFDQWQGDADEWCNWTVTNAIRADYLSGNNNISFWIFADAIGYPPQGGDYVNFYSKEDNVNNNRPYLNITYSGGSFNISDCTALNSENGIYYLISDITDSSTSNCMDITANNVTLDCQGHTIDGADWADIGIRIFRASATKTDITIKNCNISDWDSYGISVNNGDFLSIYNSTIESNPDYGMYFGADNITIQDVKSVDNGLDGLFIQEAGNFTITNSNFTNNGRWDIHHVVTSGYCNGTIFDNVLGTDYQPILYYSSKVIIDSWDDNFTSMILCDADSSVLNNINFTGNSSNGIILTNNNNVNISNMNLKNLYDSIHVVSDHNLRIINTTINNSENSGIWFRSDGDIDNVNVSHSKYGVLFATEDNANITNCELYNNTVGVEFQTGSDGNSFSGNKIYANDIGIYFDESNSDSNVFFNNLINNSQNVKFDNYQIQYWNTTLSYGTNIHNPNNDYIGGNYWTNTIGTGFSENCTDADYDGFCDNWYNVSADNATGIAGDNVDYLPLSDEYDDPANMTSISDGTDPIQESSTQTITPSTVTDLESDNLYIYCCQDTTNTCTPTTSDLCDNNQAWASPYATMTCTLTTPDVTDITIYNARCRLYDGKRYSFLTFNTSYTVFECDQNSDCAANQFCNESQICQAGKAHGSTCDLTDLYLDSDGEDSICTDGSCNAGYCNNRSVVTAVNISSSHMLNRSNESLTYVFSYYDANSDIATMNQSFWYNNTLHLALFDNLTTIYSNYTQKLQNWTISIRVFDGYNWSDWLNSSSLEILNTPPTMPTLHSPSDLTAIADDSILLNYSSTDPDNWTDTITYWLYNSSVNGNFSLLYNGTSETYNWSSLVDGSYYWKIKAGDGEENSSNSSIYQFSVSTVYPAITLNYPSNNYYFNTRNISHFNFTAIDANGLSECHLYHTLNGTWLKNMTTAGATSGSIFSWNYTHFLIDESSYIYNVWCNDTINNGGYATSNLTFHIDTVKPNVTLLSPTQGASYTSLSVLLEHVDSDYSLKQCQYSYSVGGATSSNITVTCNSAQNIVFSVYGTYTLDYYSIDQSNNINFTSVSFTISAPATPPTDTEGGGGGTVTVFAGLELYRPKSGSTIQMYQEEGKYTIPVEFIVRNNGDGDGWFTFEIEENPYLMENCIFNFTSVLIEPGLDATNTISCLAHTDTQEGKIKISAGGKSSYYRLYVAPSQLKGILQGIFAGKGVPTKEGIVDSLEVIGTIISFGLILVPSVLIAIKKLRR